MLVRPITYKYSMQVVLLAFSLILLNLKTSLCITLLPNSIIKTNIDALVGVLEHPD